MAAAVYVADGWQSPTPASPADHNLLFQDDGYYWHLYRYFEGANLDRRRQLIDLYGGGEIDGYQLDRLEEELRSALEDVSHKSDKWRVLTGWNEYACRENEIWRDVEKERLLDVIKKMLWLICFAREKKLKLICSGD